MCPPPVGPTTAKFKTAAAAVDGIPQAVGATSTGKLRVPLPTSAGPPVTPVAPRVSTSRHGVTEKN
jgi:hypothetical protein